MRYISKWLMFDYLWFAITQDGANDDFDPQVEEASCGTVDGWNSS